MGRPLKIMKNNSAASPSGLVDSGYPNDGTTDNGFDADNPGVVGGNIPDFDESYVIDADVCVEQAQYGTIYSTDGITVVWGAGDADFTNTIGSNSIIYAAGLDDAIGVVNTVNTPASVTCDSAAASTDLILTKGATAATALVVNGPVVFNLDFAGLTAGVVYYVKATPDSTHFSVSLTPGGTVIQLTDDSDDVTASQGQTVTLDDPATATVSNSAWTSATPDNGHIIRQKGKRKFLVARDYNVQDEFIAQGGAYMITTVSETDWQALGAGPDATNGKIFTASTSIPSLSTNGVAYALSVCTLVDKARASLLRNEMSINLNKASGPDVKASSITDHFAVDFTDNGTDENAGTKYIATFDGASDTEDPATGLISVAVENYC
jgi:hypothetical protein